MRDRDRDVDDKKQERQTEETVERYKEGKDRKGESGNGTCTGGDWRYQVSHLPIKPRFSLCTINQTAKQVSGPAFRYFSVIKPDKLMIAHGVTGFLT